MPGVRRLIGATAAAALLMTLVLALFAGLRGRSQNVPWAPLDLADPVGPFTGRKLAALGGEFGQCRALLNRAGVRYDVLPAVHAGRCGYDDAVRFAAGGARRIAFQPAGVGVSCPVAAALSVWEWEVIQPAARRFFGQQVVGIDHFGSYGCRRQYGRATGSWSEHATANAIDIAGFRLADGSRITIAGDWRDRGDRGSFLRSVRNGACALFATTLSPDYNAAHRDHLHLDQAARGAAGWRACR